MRERNNSGQKEEVLTHANTHQHIQLGRCRRAGSAYYSNGKSCKCATSKTHHRKGCCVGLPVLKDKT